MLTDKSPSSTRNTNIEFLRYALMIGICLWHTLVHGFSISKIEETHLSLSAYEILLMSIFVPCVNCFMLLSGYYGINYSNKKAIHFVLKAFVFYWTLQLLDLTIYNESPTITQLVKYCLPICTGYWWFLTYYVLIFFLSPILNTGIDIIGKDKFRTILIVFITINSVGLFITNQSNGSNFLSLLTMYMLGRYVSQNKLGGSKRIYFVSYAFFLSMTFFIALILYGHGYFKAFWRFFQYNNPLVICMAVSCISLILKFKPRSNKFSAFVGRHSLSIYMLTTMPLYIQWANIYKNSILLCIASIILVTIPIMLYDVFVQYGIDWFTNKFMSKIK